jgi:hypothetical protein
VFLKLCFKINQPKICQWQHPFESPHPVRAATARPQPLLSLSARRHFRRPLHHSASNPNLNHRLNSKPRLFERRTPTDTAFNHYLRCRHVDFSLPANRRCQNLDHQLQLYMSSRDTQAPDDSSPKLQPLPKMSACRQFACMPISNLLL